jgi:MYND finger
MEIEAGLRKPKPKLEEMADQVAMCQRGLSHILGSGDRTFWDSNQKGLKEAEAEIAVLLRSGAATQADVDAALSKAREKYAGKDSELRAVYHAWKAENPQKTIMEVGGADSQRLYDAVASKPPSAAVDAVDKRVCGWCKKNYGEQQLLVCGACRAVSYCDVTCQRAAWEGHKAFCRASRVSVKPKEKTRLPLTWEQLEAFGDGVEATGKTLEVRLVEDQTVMRQVFSCKDHAGVLKTLAAYTNDGRISGLAPGKVLRWKNPRCHFFLDGSRGARVEDGDIKNIEVE